MKVRVSKVEHQRLKVAVENNADKLTLPIDGGASDFAKATPDKSQGKQDRPATAKLRLES